MPERLEPKQVMMNQYQAARVLGLSPRSCRDLFGRRGIAPCVRHHGRQRESLYGLDDMLNLRDSLRDRRDRGGEVPAPSRAGPVAQPSRNEPRCAMPVPQPVAAGLSIEEVRGVVAASVRAALREQGWPADLHEEVVAAVRAAVREQNWVWPGGGTWPPDARGGVGAAPRAGE